VDEHGVKADSFLLLTLAACPFALLNFKKNDESRHFDRYDEFWVSYKDASEDQKSGLFVDPIPICLTLAWSL